MVAGKGQLFRSDMKIISAKYREIFEENLVLKSAVSRCSPSDLSGVEQFSKEVFQILQFLDVWRR